MSFGADRNECELNNSKRNSNTAWTVLVPEIISIKCVVLHNILSAESQRNEKNPNKITVEHCENIVTVIVFQSDRRTSVIVYKQFQSIAE